MHLENTPPPSHIHGSSLHPHARRTPYTRELKSGIRYRGSSRFLPARQESNTSPLSVCYCSHLTRRVYPGPLVVCREPRIFPSSLTPQNSTPYHQIGSLLPLVTTYHHLPSRLTFRADPYKKINHVSAAPILDKDSEQVLKREHKTRHNVGRKYAMEKLTVK